MSDDRFPPPGTGESMSKRGEDTAKENHEEGRTEMEDTGAGRPAGGSTARMKTSIDPQDPKHSDSPKNPPG